jgi:uncharacterized protein (TIGR02145 family)
MKNIYKISAIVLVTIMAILLHSCKKEEVNIIVTDIDGNVYKTLTLGTQVWMAENLKTTKYKDGTAITCPGTNFTLWANNTDGAFASYNNDAANKNAYGALYNWHAVNTNKLCPSGWHVPSNDEWATLVTYVGDNAGGKMKEAGTVHWQTPNEGATNESGFSALPGGDRTYMGAYELIGESGNWWSSSEYRYNIALSRGMNYFSTEVYYNNDMYKGYGFSVRCIKDY